jgi:hypothetical protein
MNSHLIINGGLLVVSLSAVVGLTIAGTLHKLGRELSEFLESDAWSSPQLVPVRRSSYDRAHAARHLTLVKPLRE